MHYAIITYHNDKRFNIGDYIQSLAACQFLPHVDAVLNRETLNKYTGPELKLIMNGWFMHNPKNWPPSPNITPLFISFHLTKRAANTVLDSERISYLQQYEVGARDYHTLELLSAKGIRSYFSGCLTLTLGNSYKHQPGTDIYFVDVLHKPQFFGRRSRIIKGVFGKEMVKSAKHITHRYLVRDYPTEGARLQLADDLLNLYQNARLVVTSRLHCALPCLAMGTPVIYVDVGVSKERVRFKGLSEVLNIIKIEKGKAKADFDLTNVRNKTLHLEYVRSMENRCRDFILS